MVGVFNKELLSWEYATRELRRQGLLNHAAERPPQTSRHEQQPKSEPIPMVVDREILDQGEESKLESEPQSESESEGVNEPEWIISIKERLEEAIQEDVAGSKGKCCIYKVPHFLRNEGDDKAYTPQVVSIGPYHRGWPQLVAMDRHKWRALYHILDREQQDVALYVNAMKELEGRTRGCYEDPLNLESNEFVEMMVLDGCFVTELLKGCVEGFENLGYERDDPVFAMRGMMSSVQRDMMMIENQIPLFVLDRLFALQLGIPVKKGLIAELALRFFNPMLPTDETLTTGQKIKLESSVDAKEVKLHLLPDESGLHCLDLFRSSLLRKDLEREPRLSDRKWSLVVRQKLIHSITELKESGVEFKKRKTDRFWDIKFKNGVLQIPRLLVQDSTKSLFLNLMAYEQSNLDCTNHITAYVVFMNDLINSAQDVSYLRHNGILEHWLDNDVEVANMFSHLCRQVTFNISDSYLSKVSEEIDVYHRSRWSVWKASLKHNYFHNPWAVTAFLAAIFFILLTTAQTYYSVYSYYKPRN